MAESSRETDSQAGTIAFNLSSLLQEHNGQNVCVLDLRSSNNWTDYFVIATVTSRTHMDGLQRHIRDFCHEKGIDIFGSSRNKGSSKKNLTTKGARIEPDDEWRLIDLGSVIIHLMTAATREFYDLERLWKQ